MEDESNGAWRVITLAKRAEVYILERYFSLITANLQKEPHLSPRDRWGTRKPGMATSC
jgi:hypothetical protein